MARRSSGTPGQPLVWMLPCDSEGVRRICRCAAYAAQVAADEAPDLDLSFLASSARPTDLKRDAGALGVVDLFSGCGGLSIGVIEAARRRGVLAEVVLAVDQWQPALAVLQQSLGMDDGRVMQADLGAVLPRCGRTPDAAAKERLTAVAASTNLLVAGPPCQGHSALNNHTRHDDDRNGLYMAMADAAELLDPEVVVIENVRGVANDRRRGLQACRSRLEEHYQVADEVVDLHVLGAPQRRLRHVLVAAKANRFDFDAVPLRAGRDVRWAIRDLHERPGGTLFDTASVPSEENATRMAWLVAQPDQFDLPNALRPICHRSDHSYRSMYGQLRWGEPAQTITSGFGSMGQGRFVHPQAARTLTPHEAARLQCLPDWMDFSGVEHRNALATMIGNAAPPIPTIALVEALFEQGLLGGEAGTAPDGVEAVALAATGDGHVAPLA